MSWRTILVTNKAKLSYKNNYLLVRNDEIKMIHLSEIDTIIIDTTAVSITAFLIAELIKRKIKLIFCDENHNPTGEVIPYYGNHRTSKRVSEQVDWNEDIKKRVWTKIIQHKILNQANLMKSVPNDNYQKLYEYAVQLQLYDTTNREGHAAKVYFNTLFGMDFNRDLDNDINAALNYGYSILLSQFNKEVVNCGYITQLGMKHCNEFNQFNLSSDMMEPFRVLIDRVVFENKTKPFDGWVKAQLVDVLNKQVFIDKHKQYVSNAISIYVRSVFMAIDKEDISLIEFFEEL